MAVALAEACFNPERELGAEIEPVATDADAEAWFGEGASSVILSAPAENLKAIHDIFAPLEVRPIGRVSAAARLKLGRWLDEDVVALRRLYEEALPGRLGRHD